jgi:hypothetical protein
MRLPQQALRVFNLLAFNHEWIRMGATSGAVPRAVLRATIGAIIESIIDTSVSNAAVDRARKSSTESLPRFRGHASYPRLVARDFRAIRSLDLAG